MTVCAMRRGEDVPFRHRARHADGDRLLADGHVQEAGQLAGAELLLDLFLEAPDEQHLAVEVPQALLREPALPCRLCLGHEPEFMLLTVGLAAQWDRIVSQLPAIGRRLGVQLRLARAERRAAGSWAARIAEPGRCRRRAAPAGDYPPEKRGPVSCGGSWPGSTSRTSGARSSSRAPRSAAAEAAARPSSPSDAPTASLALARDELVAGLPDDWSDLLVLVELRSSDELAPAALALAPLNPSRHGVRSRSASEWPVASATGRRPRWHVAASSASTSSAFPGALRLLEVLSDTQPVLTQGPTFVVSDRAV